MTTNPVLLAWHDVTCPEGPECRSRALHAASDLLATSGVIERFLDRLEIVQGGLLDATDTVPDSPDPERTSKDSMREVPIDPDSGLPHPLIEVLSDKGHYAYAEGSIYEQFGQASRQAYYPQTQRVVHPAEWKIWEHYCATGVWDEDLRLHYDQLQGRWVPIEDLTWTSATARPATPDEERDLNARLLDVLNSALTPERCTNGVGYYPPQSQCALPEGHDGPCKA